MLVFQFIHLHFILAKKQTVESVQDDIVLDNGLLVFKVGLCMCQIVTGQCSVEDLRS